MKIISLVFLFLFCFQTFAEIEIKLPELRGPVVDEVGFLEYEEQNELTETIKKIINLGGPHIQILMVDNLQGHTPEDFSIYVAETWQIGTGKEDNGIIILVAKEERKIRIEVGNGIEDRLTDYTTSMLIQDYLTPQFKNSRYFLGLRYTLEEIAKIFEIKLDPGQNKFQPIRLKKNQPTKTYLILPFLIFFIFIYPIYIRFLGTGRIARGGLGSIFFLLLSFVIIPVISIPIIAIFAFIGFFIGLIGPSNFLMSLNHHRSTSPWNSRGGGFGGGFEGSSGNWGGRGGGFSGGGASGDW